MQTYQALLDQASKQLHECSDTPRIDAEYLLQDVVGQSMAWLICHGNTPVDPAHLNAFRNMVHRRSEGEPVAYILGYRDFWTLKLEVNEHVLIPRPDTETLVEQALAMLDQQPTPSVLDLGTGSGAIALAIAKEKPSAQLTAVDAHANALAVAQRNAQLNNVNNVNFMLSNWFSELAAAQNYDLIASNPPYIDAQDTHLQRGDLRFEPDTALISDQAGLGDLQRIINTAPHYLKPSGALVLEHGYQQGQAVAQLLNRHGFTNIELHSDLNQLPRCTSAILR